jgi:ABC-type Na+ efflux pump permease subunit
MEKLSRTLRALARADTLIATIWLTVAAKRGGLIWLAALIATLGFGMLNAAGYFAIEPRLGSLWAATCVAAADFLIAAGLLVVSSFVRPKRDLDLALELRDNAIEQLAAIAANPVDLAGRALLVPLTAVVSRYLRTAAGGAPKGPGEK